MNNPTPSLPEALVSRDTLDPQNWDEMRLLACGELGLLALQLPLGPGDGHALAGPEPEQVDLELQPLKHRHQFGLESLGPFDGTLASGQRVLRKISTHQDLFWYHLSTFLSQH